MVLAVMPGADADRAALEPPALEAGPPAELELEEHAAAASAAAVATAMAGTRSRCGLFIECLLSHEVPEDRPPGLAEPGAAGPTRRRAPCWRPAWTPRAVCGRRRA